MLRRGGSATDAAIATMLALNVVEPQSSGIGGGGFFLRGQADGKVETLDGREAAPGGADGQWFLDADGKPLGFMEAVISGRSVGVPGNLRLAEEAHRRYGKLPWAELFEPAIALARGGWTLTERGHEFLVRAKNRAAHQPEGLALYYDAAGEALPVGTPARQSGARRDARSDSRERGGLVLFGRQRGSHGSRRRCRNPARRRADRAGPRCLPGQRAPRCLRRLPRLPDLRDGPALVGGDDRFRHPQATRTVRPARARAALADVLAPVRRIAAARLRRPRTLPRRYRLRVGAGQPDWSIPTTSRRAAR